MKGGLEREGPGRMPLRRDGSRRRGPPLRKECRNI